MKPRLTSPVRRFLLRRRTPFKITPSKARSGYTRKRLFERDEMTGACIPPKKRARRSIADDPHNQSVQVCFENIHKIRRQGKKKQITLTKAKAQMSLDESVQFVCETTNKSLGNTSSAEKLNSLKHCNTRKWNKRVNQPVSLHDDVIPVEESKEEPGDEVEVLFCTVTQPSALKKTPKKEPTRKATEPTTKNDPRKNSATRKMFFEDRTGNLDYVSLIRNNRKNYGREMVESKNNDREMVESKSSEDEDTNSGELREIIVDGCNIASAYNNGKIFDERGIKLVVDYFANRGHRVTVFVPQHKRSKKRPLLEQYYKEGIVVFTASRKVGDKHISSYDDRYILEYATMRKGIVISLDQFRDLYRDKPEWRSTISERILQPTFVGDVVMFPDDPLGRRGPTLEQFLRH